MIASGRELTGGIEATLHRAQSQASSHGMSALSWVAGRIGLDDASDRLAKEAERARTTGEQRAVLASRQAHADAEGTRAFGERTATAIGNDGQWVAGKLQNGFATAGAHVDRGYDLVASKVKGVTAQAPAAMATVGGISVGVGTAAATHVPTGVLPLDAVKLSNLAQSARLIRDIGPAFGEATARHGMAETVIPSLDSELIKQEAVARKLVEQHQRIQHPEDGRRASVAAEPAARGHGINDPGHTDYRLFNGAQTGVHALDRAHNRVPDLQSDQLAGALAVQAKREGLESISHVVLSEDHSRAFAVDTPDLNAAHRRHAHVDVAAGMAQPLSASTAQVDAINASREQAQGVSLAQQQVQETQEQARRMG